MRAKRAPGAETEPRLPWRGRRGPLATWLLGGSKAPPRDIQIIGSDRGRAPRGKARSIMVISPALRIRSPAPAFSIAWSGEAALGMANSGALRVRKASATWRGA